MFSVTVQETSAVLHKILVPSNGVEGDCWRALRLEAEYTVCRRQFAVVATAKGDERSPTAAKMACKERYVHLHDKLDPDAPLD